MACNSDTECIICFEECTSDDNYMNTRVVSDISGNVDSTICNCSYNLHQSCYLEYIKKFGMTCMVCKKDYVPYKYVLQQDMTNVYIGVGRGGGVGGVGVGLDGVGVDRGGVDGVGVVGGGRGIRGIRGIRGLDDGLERVFNNVGYSQTECQRIIKFLICFLICIFVCICVYILHLLFFL